MPLTEYRLIFRVLICKGAASQNDSKCRMRHQERTFVLSCAIRSKSLEWISSNLMEIFARRFDPATESANILEIKTNRECRTVFEQEFAVIFKHSDPCDLSRDAYLTVSRFCAERADTNVYLISVLNSWAAARFVEKQTGVRHQSPQVLALRNGTVFAHASHRNITPGFLRELHAT